MDKVLWLQQLCNKYGDFKVTRSFKGRDGRNIFTKHKSVLQCWHDDDIATLVLSTHRTPFQNEVFIDLDKRPNIIHVYRIVSWLNGLKDVHSIRPFFSGSNGYHIHVVIPWLGFEKRSTREHSRHTFLRNVQDIVPDIHVDMGKKSDGSMLAMEYQPHWKTGRHKLPVVV